MSQTATTNNKEKLYLQAGMMGRRVECGAFFLVLMNLALSALSFQSLTRLDSHPFPWKLAIFPSNNKYEDPLPPRDQVRMPITRRNKKVADVLRELIQLKDQEQALQILDGNSVMLLEPFLVETPSEESIFRKGESLQERRDTYYRVMRERISTTQAPAQALALKRMMLYVLSKVDD
ncbi:unnamed protein product, partial [Heterosigma akashiwo]